MKLSPGNPRCRGRRRSARAHRIVDRFGLSAHGHHDAAFGIELDHHVRAFIHDPNVVLRIDADGMRLDEPIESLPDFADIFSVLVEFKKARGGTHKHPVRARGQIHRARARVDENVSLGICGHAQDLAQVDVIRHFQKIGRGVVGNFRNRLGKQVGTARENSIDDANEKIERAS